MATTKFWIEDPCILFTDIVFFPTSEMSKEQKLNALTRLAIVITIIMFALDYEHWLIFLLLSILFIIIAQYSTKGSIDIGEGPGGAALKENFSIVPTRIDDEWTTVTVAPTFAEETRVIAPAYDLYEGVEFIEPPFEEPCRPQSWPNGQYLSRTNLLPSDEYMVHMNPSGGAQSAREYVGSKFLAHDLAFRENMSRVFKKSLARRFRTNFNDTFSPFQGY